MALQDLGLYQRHRLHGALREAVRADPAGEGFGERRTADDHAHLSTQVPALAVLALKL